MVPGTPDFPMPTNTTYKALKNLIKRASRMHWRFIAAVYLAAYLGVELFAQNPVQVYIFVVFLALSGIYFSWFMGGMRTMRYVGFFSLFIVFVFTRLLFSQGVITTEVFGSRSFLAMYAMTALLLVLMQRTESPADATRRKREQVLSSQRDRTNTLEFMVASNKLRLDLTAQANLVKDELQVLKGAWKSNIHSIINDLPTVTERALYEQIIEPFQENIITHLRNLESQLSFEVAPHSLDEAEAFLRGKAEGECHGGCGGLVEVQDFGWAGNTAMVRVDLDKMWDVALNLIRNSRTAMDLQRVEALRQGRPMPGPSTIRIELGLARGPHGSEAVLAVVDNGGGVEPAMLDRLFHEPVPSAKRGGKKSGQGTIFVKFFAERMDMRVEAGNVGLAAERGLRVALAMPVLSIEAANETDVNTRQNGKQG